MSYFPNVWQDTLHRILEFGADVAPRNQVTKELLQHTMVVDMRRPVLTITSRQLSYQFMAAEAYWILSGDDRVATIAPYNKRIDQFSDNGSTFFGAYGPKIMGQLDYVVNKLIDDHNTRQAGLVIWRENPPPTKDVPCTVAIFFNIRDGRLNCHVFMRSSDAWLGVPYDVFNFSMLSHLVCSFLNESKIQPQITPGMLYLTAASSHLYKNNFEAAAVCLKEPVVIQRLTPANLYTDSAGLMDHLKALRDTKPGHPLRWWEVHRG